MFLYVRSFLAFFTLNLINLTVENFGFEARALRNIHRFPQFSPEFMTTYAMQLKRTMYGHRKELLLDPL